MPKKKAKKGEDAADDDDFPRPPGLVDAHTCASVFTQPAWLRDVLRSGLPDHFVFDLENCHLAILRERHSPAEDSALEIYYNQRDKVLQETHKDRAVAKQLFIQLVYGGTVDAWKFAHGVTGEFGTEALARKFAQEMAELRLKDCDKNPELLAKLKRMTARPVEFLQYALNTARERELIDKVALGEARGDDQKGARRLSLHRQAHPVRARGHEESGAGHERRQPGPQAPL